MLNQKIEKFLEKNNFTYLYLLLANLEAERLNNIPFTVRKKFDKKITELALEHVADNDIKDYIIEKIEEDEDKENDENENQLDL